MSALLRSRQTSTHSVWSAHSHSIVNSSSEDKSSLESTSTKSTSQSEHRVKPGRNSTLHLGQNIRGAASVLHPTLHTPETPRKSPASVKSLLKFPVSLFPNSYYCAAMILATKKWLL